MSEELKGFLGLMFVIFSLFWLLNSHIKSREEYCHKFGSEWEYVDGKFSYCVNPSGDIKGIYVGKR